MNIRASTRWLYLKIALIVAVPFLPAVANYAMTRSLLKREAAHSVMIDEASQQRMRIEKYTAEIAHVLTAISLDDWKTAIASQNPIADFKRFHRFEAIQRCNGGAGGEAGDGLDVPASTRNG